MKEYNKGITLIEIILAIALIGIVSITCLNLITAGFKSITRAGKSSEDQYFAQSDIETKIANDSSGTLANVIIDFNGPGGFTYQINNSGDVVYDNSNLLRSFLTDQPVNPAPSTDVVSITINRDHSVTTDVMLGVPTSIYGVISPAIATNKNITWYSNNASLTITGTNETATINSTALASNVRIRATSNENPLVYDEVFVNVITPIRFSAKTNGDYFLVNGVLSQKISNNTVIVRDSLAVPKKQADAATIAVSYSDMGSFKSSSTLLLQATATTLSSSILDNDTNWWTSTHKSGNDYYYVSSSGSILFTSKNDDLYVRPIVVLNQNYIILSGSGSLSDPYILSTSY